MFEKTWGSEGTGTIEYSITGKQKHSDEPFNNSNIENVSELELGTYTITCKMTSPKRKEVYATAQKEVKVTALANDIVTNDTGTEVQAYAIYSGHDLAEFRDLVNAGQANINAKQKQDINLNQGKWTTNEEGITTFANNAVQWIPIGKAIYNQNTSQLLADKPFNGIYDGTEKEINGLYIINNDSSYYVGLFSYSEGTIKNVTLKNSTIISSYKAGGILGKGKNMNILNCKNYANIKSTLCVGGICGEDTSVDGVEAKIENCENYGLIEESKKIEVVAGFGGIIGYAEGKLLNCRNYGKVIANYSNINNDSFGVAGIVGRIEQCEVTNCSNEADIKTVGGVAAGIAGYSSYSSNGRIEGCYNTGDITSNMSNGGYSGGIIAWGTNIDVINCYNRGNITGDWAGGIATWTR